MPDDPAYFSRARQASGKNRILEFNNCQSPAGGNNRTEADVPARCRPSLPTPPALCSSGNNTGASRVTPDLPPSPKQERVWGRREEKQRRPMSVESSDGNKHRGEDGGSGRKTFQHLG